MYRTISVCLIAIVIRLRRLAWGPAVFVVVLFGMSPDVKADDLAQRFEKLSCAVVHITADGGEGTGFFINQHGLVLTAAHVVFVSQWALRNNNPVIDALIPKAGIKMTLSDGRTIPITEPIPSDNDRYNAGYDLAAIQTGISNTCYTSIDTKATNKVGQELIGIGFPSLNPEGVLYGGFLSSAHARYLTPVGVVGNQVIMERYDVLRVQMPITPGASGGPIFNDSDVTVHTLPFQIQIGTFGGV